MHPTTTRGTPPPQGQRPAKGPWDFDMRRGCPASVDSPDYIGVESCADMLSDGDEVVAEADISRTSWCTQRKGEGRRVSNHERKEHPPLIPLLARTENLHSHMPWVLTRHYTPDGRLILTEEKIRHHEYFHVHRHDGRLVLQLVPLDDEVSSYHPDRRCKDEYDGAAEDVLENQAGSPHSSLSLNTSPSAEDDHDEHDEHFHNDDVNADVSEDEEEEGLKKAENGGCVSCGVGGSKCLNYNSVGVVGSPSSSAAAAAGSCILGMPLPALRQVHS